MLIYVGCMFEGDLCDRQISDSQNYIQWKRKSLIADELSLLFASDMRQDPLISQTGSRLKRSLQDYYLAIQDGVFGKA